MDLKSPIFEEKKICQRLGVFRSLVAWEETGGYNNSCCDATSSQGGLILSLHGILLPFYFSLAVLFVWLQFFAQQLNSESAQDSFSTLFLSFFLIFSLLGRHLFSWRLNCEPAQDSFSCFLFFRFSLYGATSSKGDIIRGDIQSFWETWGSIALKKSSFRKL